MQDTGNSTHEFLASFTIPETINVNIPTKDITLYRYTLGSERTFIFRVVLTAQTTQFHFTLYDPVVLSTNL